MICFSEYWKPGLVSRFKPLPYFAVIVPMSRPVTPCILELALTAFATIAVATGNIGSRFS
jgi:hypothetical protein